MNSTEWFRANGFHNTALTTIRRKRTRTIYYNQIYGDLAHCSIFDRNHNALILDESVIDGGRYELTSFGQDIFLDSQGQGSAETVKKIGLGSLKNRFTALSLTAS